MTHKGRPTAVKKIVAENRKARYNYEIMDTYEAGLMLTGTDDITARMSAPDREER